MDRKSDSPFPRCLLLCVVGCAGILLGFFPLLQLLTALWDGGPSRALLRLPFLLFSGLLGFFLNRLFLTRTGLNRFCRWCLLLAAAIPISACGFLPILSSSFEDGTAAGALFAAALLFASRYSGRRYEFVLSGGAYRGLAIVYLLFLIIPAAVQHWIPIPYSQLANAWCFLLISALYALVKNQANIDDLTQNRRYSLNCLPPRIRRYNLLLLGAVLLLTVLFFVWAIFLLPHMDELLDLLIQWWKSRISHGTSSPPVSSEPLPSMETPLPPEGFGESNDSLAWLGTLLQFLFGALLIGGVLSILILNRKSIADAIRRLCQRIASLFARLLERSPHFAEKGEEDADYTDYDQTVSGEIRRDSPSSLWSRRQWRKNCKQYFSMKDSPEKYRAGYRLAREGLILAGGNIPPADTPLDVSRKFEFLFSGGAYVSATEGFDLLYYGETAYSPENLSALSDALVQIRTLLYRKDSPLSQSSAKPSGH